MNSSLEFSSKYGIFDSINATYAFLLRCKKEQRGRDSIHWIQHYLPVLRKYAKECAHITELGVNQVISTWAFLAARPKTLVSIDKDLHKNPTKRVPEFKGVNYWLLSAIELAKKEGIVFVPKEADDAAIEIEPTELLFIDTLHREYHLRKELSLHKDKVSKFLIFHDTVLFGRELNGPIDELIKTGEWIEVKRFTSNPGLRILKRKI